MINFLKLYKLLNDLYIRGNYILSYERSTNTFRLIYIDFIGRFHLSCEVEGIYMDDEVDNELELLTALPAGIPFETGDIKISTDKNKIIIKQIYPPSNISFTYEYDYYSASMMLSRVQNIPYKYSRDFPIDVYIQVLKHLKHPSIESLKLQMSSGWAVIKSVHIDNQVKFYSKSVLCNDKDIGADSFEINMSMRPHKFYKLLYLSRILLSHQKTQIYQYGGHTAISTYKEGKLLPVIDVHFYSGAVDIISLESYRDIKNLKYLCTINSPEKFDNHLYKYKSILDYRSMYETFTINTGTDYSINYDNVQIDDKYPDGFHANSDKVDIYTDVLYKGLSAYIYFYPKSKSVQISQFKDDENVYVFHERDQDNYIYIKVGDI